LCNIGFSREIQRAIHELGNEFSFTENCEYSAILKRGLCKSSASKYGVIAQQEVLETNSVRGINI